MSVSPNNIPKLFLIFQRDVSQLPGTWRQTADGRLSALLRAPAILEHILAYCVSQLLRFIIRIHPHIYTSCYSFYL